MSPKGGGPGGTGGSRPEDPKGPRRGIGAGGARSAASRLRAVRIALAHDLVRAGRILDRRGMIAADQGDLSARISGDRVLITRRGRRKGDLTPRDFVEMGVVEPRDSPVRGAASPEYRMHLAAYAVRRDVEAIVHAHPISLTAYAMRGHAPDFSRVDEARASLGRVGFVAYHPSGTEELAESVALVLGPVAGAPPMCVLVLQNHGALAVGANVEEAVCRLEIAEHLAASLLLAERGRS
jgi:L-fuculose-phosphate aldolase